MLRRIFMVLAVVGAGAVHAAAPAMEYIYPPPQSGSDQRLEYYWHLMRAALQATTPKWGPYTLAPAEMSMNSDRAQILLARSEGLSVLVRTTSADREALLLPLRFPIDRGLTGYRLFLIQKSTQAKVEHVRTLEDLKAFSIGQGLNWVDTEILRSAGLTVETGGNYESLFKMLSVGRFDLFSRGVNEISKELSEGHAANSDLAIENNLVLYYPLPRYWFFARTPEGTRLARRVEEGLAIMLRNGEFDRRYREFKHQILADVNLAGRRIIKIPNPTLSPDTPLGKKDYWDTLADELKAPH